MTRESNPAMVIVWIAIAIVVEALGALALLAWPRS